MFKAFYGMKFNPFDKQLKESFGYRSHDFTEMSSRLEMLKSVMGIGVFTAPPGCGKTFALRCFAKSLNPSLFQIEYICLSTVSLIDFYRQLCSALGLEPNQRKSSMFKDIQERLYVTFKDKRRPLILALDEAHELDSRILKDLRMLLNLQYDSLNCCAVVLLGEPHLNNILEKPVHEALRQRITVHYNFCGLDQSETGEYIIHKIEAAGANSSIVAPSAMLTIHNYSRGVPRVIDNVMTDALMIGCQLGKQIIDNDIILAAINNHALT